MKLYTLPLLSTLAMANPITEYAGLYERAAVTPGKVPETTPTGTPCTAVGATQTPISTAELELAVAGCIGIQAAGTNDTRNDILEGICKPFTLIFARGTTEDPNLGNIVGPPFIVALDAVFGTSNVAVQGVNNYAADAAEYCEGGSLTGSEDLASLIEQTMSQCPKTKLCVSGYSQGCQVVHNAFELLTSNPAATNFVNSVVLFGDPDRGLPVGNVPAYKVSTDCHVGDNICQDGEVILPPHLTYCHDVGVEAAFAKARSLEAN